MMQVLDVTSIFIHTGNFEPLNRPLEPPSNTSIMEAQKLAIKIFPSHNKYAY